MTVNCPKCQTENPVESSYCSKCGTRIEPATAHIPVLKTETFQTPIKELATGSTFAGRYQVIEELGRGGMGKVYKVFDTKIKEKVALKLIRPEIASDKDTIARFSNELRLARGVRHKNVCGMFDIGEAEGAHFITMEYVPGEDLKSMIRMAAGLSIGAVLSIGRQICEGLAEAHSLGVVHRDLKPHNVMIDRGGHAKIMDFGIARSVKEKGITGPSVLIGTPEYMSPEQAEAKGVDQRSDIYSLGIILYEMATGRVPFEGETALSIAMKQKTETPRDPKELNPQIPQDLSRLILRCLAKDRDRRYQSADELLAELSGIEKAQKDESGEKKTEKSIAVLPFADLSAKKDQEFFCDGMAEEIISSLTKIKDLRVVARTSAFSFKGKDLDVREIGQRLNVETVLEGSVRKAGKRLRITADLIKVGDGYHIWSERFDCEMDDIFAIQDNVTLAIIEKLKVEFLEDDKARLAKSQTRDIDAYDLYLKGRFAWNQRTPDRLLEAIHYFEEAIKIDRGYALAYLGLAETYIVIGGNSFQRPSVVYPKAEEFCLKALALDEDLAEAHSALGAIKAEWKWDFEGAEKEYLRAIEIKPHDATAHQWLSELHLTLRRTQAALEEIRIAEELDPRSIIIKDIETVIYLAEGRFDEAVRVMKRGIEENPDFDVGRFHLHQAYLMKGLYDEALKIAEEIRLPGFKFILKGRVFAARGETTEARRMLEKALAISQDVYIDPCIIALLYGDLGELDDTFSLYETALEQRSSILPRFNYIPPHDRVRQDPRFKALLKKIGLEK